jgi:serine/threonine-protein kinase
MGAVFEADGPPGVGRRAIKLLHTEFARDPVILSRFFSEFQAATALQHPNVAQTLETGKAENGTPYLVMELLQGTPVSSYVDRNVALPAAQAVHIAHGVLLALSAAHARNIVHRDIKPDNLFLVNDNAGSFNVKVLDFGIAKVMDVAGGMGQKTRTGVLLGTPGYMSPEQIKYSKGVDGRADLWSLGVIFYELLTGASPFPAENEFTRLTAVLTDELKPIADVTPSLGYWGGFLQRALAKDPARRFQTADEMDAALFATVRGTSAARSPSVRPPATLAIDSPPGDRPSAVFGAPVERPSAVFGAPVVGHQGTTAMPTFTDGATNATPASPPYVDRISNFGSAATMGGTPSPPAPGHSGVMPAPSPTHVEAVSQGVSQGSIPPPRAPFNSSPMTPLAAPAVPSGMSVGPTHVSAQSPPVAQVPLAPIAVVDAPPRPGAPYWVVVVVGLVAFGLGLALGLALR